MDIQKINVKLFVDSPDPVPLDPFLAIFGRWREDRSDPSEWVDLADYAHVERGPGIMLIGHRGNLSVDLGQPGPGLLYANKQGLEGALGERIHEAFSRAAALSRKLIADPDYPEALVPRAGSWELTLNDRLTFPNTDAVDREVRPLVGEIGKRLFGNDVTVIRQPDSARRYALMLHSDSADSLDALARVFEAGA